MATTPASIAQDYVELALAMDQHIPGYVDAYFGPPEWREQARSRGPRPAAELAKEAAQLAAALTTAIGLDPQRRDFLTRQVRALHTSLCILQGDRFSLLEETQALYDVTPRWIDEAVFDAAHHHLDDLLPKGGSLAERMRARKRRTEVPAEQLEALLPAVCEHLRDLARRRFPLPAGESFEIQLVQDRPWFANNQYLGSGRSRIEINTGFPLHITSLAFVLAHEGYPGHHTESAIKEARLVQGQGRVEHSLIVINSPACLVAEGIANHALAMLMADEEQVRWQAGELFPQAGFTHLEAQREHEIETVRRELSGVSGNAAFLLHEQGASEAETMAYLQHYALFNEEEARLEVDFLNHPAFRSYVFTYTCGAELLQALFAARGDPGYWFTRLLSEPVTPSQVREWIGK